MPCHTIRMVANDRNRLYPNRRNSGSYTVSRLADRLLHRGQQIELHDCLRGLYGCLHVRNASPVPATNAAFAARLSRQVTSCMFMAVASTSRSRFESMSSCSTNAARSWLRACRCRAPISTAPLILSRTAVALCSPIGIDDLRFERVDRR